MEADSPIQRRSDRTQAARPLRRRPKQLDRDPTAFEAVAGAGGVALRAQPGRGRTPGTRPPGGPAAGFTDDEGSVVTLGDDELAAVEPVVRERARRITARLSVPKPRRERTARRGIGEFASVAYSGGSDDLDLDRTLRVLAEKPVPEEEDLVVRERIRPRRRVVLAVDVSGSMRGERVRTAAATVGALAAELAQDALSVIAFWSDAAVLSHLSQPVDALGLLDAMLRIPARGLTNVAFPLELAARELAGVSGVNARVLLLSDCVHNAGPDPRPIAGRLPRLDVLLDASGEQDPELGRELARIGRGAFRTIRTYRDVAPALGELFGT